MEIKELMDKLNEIKSELDKKLQKGADELQKFGEPLKETKAAITTLEADIKEIKTQMVELQAKAQRPGGMGAARTERKSIGHQFTESDAYKAMIGSKRYSSDAFEVKDIVSSRLIDVTNGLPIIPEIIPGVIQEPQVELRIAGLIPNVNTSSNSIYFVRGTYTRAAAPKKESKLGAIIDKPEAKLVFMPGAETIKTIPVWIPATRQILADAPALAGLINNNLLYDVEIEKEEQILFGNGTDPNLNGICPQATPYDNTLPAALGVTSPTRIDAIRAAILQARQARYPVSGIVLNPFDWAAIELSKDAEERYIWVSVMDGGVARLWRVPIVESDSMIEGNFLAGAFGMGATLYNREGATIRISESHDKYFIENLVAILCELRCALVVTRPQAFVYGEFTPSGS